MHKFLPLLYLILIAAADTVNHSYAKPTPLHKPEAVKSENITIYYGLNDSHSRSWAQLDQNGIAGITYFQKFNNSNADGFLLYKTILPNGSEIVDSITTGTHHEKSVLLFDSLNNPHIFLALSSNSDQTIEHYFKNDKEQWQSETIIHFYNEGGKFIYELSADTGPDFSFHLVILKTRSNIDSDDFMDAWINSNLYHLTNVSGNWEKELVHNYDMAYTYDMYIKTSSRQDIKVDKEGHVHVTFSEQINESDDPSRLRYATNKTGDWEIETALNNDYGVRDDAGWFPSLCLDNNGIPHISCMYINRVLTYSARYCRLVLLKRLGKNDWRSEIIADSDDGYYGSDGRKYTGGLSHLVFDKNNTPHIIFSDIASTHWPSPENQLLNVGNIRYGFFGGGSWNIRTIYRQPLPVRFFIATEMYGMCLIVSENTDKISVIGQEMVITGKNEYSCSLLNFNLTNIPASPGSKLGFKLRQNYPNPFNSLTKIDYTVPAPSHVKLEIYNLNGQLIKTLADGFETKKRKSVVWNGSDNKNQMVSTGIYYFRILAGDKIQCRKMLYLK